MIIFLIFPLCDITITVSTTSQEVLVDRYKTESKNYAARFYAIPGFITVLKTSVI